MELECSRGEWYLVSRDGRRGDLEKNKLTSGKLEEHTDKVVFKNRGFEVQSVGELKMKKRKGEEDLGD